MNRPCFFLFLLLFFAAISISTGAYADDRMPDQPSRHGIGKGSRMTEDPEKVTKPISSARGVGKGSSRTIDEDGFLRSSHTLKEGVNSRSTGFPLSPARGSGKGSRMDGQPDVTPISRSHGVGKGSSPLEESAGGIRPAR